MLAIKLVSSLAGVAVATGIIVGTAATVGLRDPWSPPATTQIALAAAREPRPIEAAGQSPLPSSSAARPAPAQPGTAQPGPALAAPASGVPTLAASDGATLAPRQARVDGRRESTRERHQHEDDD